VWYHASVVELAGLLLFWGAAGLLAYAFVLYPLSVTLLARIVGRSVTELPWQPRVSFVITARNEERAISEKLENTLRLDYPHDHMEILVASDASSDRTDEIVRTFASSGVRLVRSQGRVGKTATTQQAIRAATGEVLVFSDATGLYEPQAVRRLVAALADPKVGCVSGRVEYRYGSSLTAQGFRLYQRLVKALRRQESALGVLTSVSGSIHAVRGEHVPRIEPHQNYDVLLPLEAAQRGLRCLYQSEAVALESSRERASDEFRARVRAGIAAFSFLSELRHRGWMLRSPLFLWALVSGKVLRWLTPVWLLALLAGQVLASTRGGVWRWGLIPHAGFWALAVLAAFLPPSRCSRILAAPLFAGTLCSAFLVGLLRYLSGDRAATWETQR
jgi:cellulose synthase/poly-beta-1,6-N-acetylglucosamine synthase-like glycosyltransferase